MYDFDKIVERRNTNAMNTDGFRQKRHEHRRLQTVHLPR